MFLARDIRHGGPAARRHENVLRRDSLAVYRNGMRIDDRGRPGEYLYARVAQQPFINTIEPLDFLVLVVDQLLPVEPALADGPAETCRILEVFREMRRVDQQLLRYAAHIDAGAAQLPFFGDRHPRAIACRHAARADAPRSGANRE